MGHPQSLPATAGSNEKSVHVAKLIKRIEEAATGRHVRVGITP